MPFSGRRGPLWILSLILSSTFFSWPPLEAAHGPTAEFGHALCENVSFRKPNEAACKQEMVELMKLQKPSYVLLTAEACERFNDSRDAVTKAIRAYDCIKKGSQLSNDPGLRGAIRKCSWQTSYFQRHDCLVRKMDKLVKKEINAILKDRVQKLLAEKRRETDRAIALRKAKNLPAEVIADASEPGKHSSRQAR
jgi:hypothetical protein